MEARILSSFLQFSSIPYSLYVARPRTFLHGLHAMVKQAWLISLLVLATRGSPTVRVAITGAVALLTAAALPRRLWEPQLKRLFLLAGFLFFCTAIGADGIPPATQARAAPPTLLGLPPMPPPGERYSHVIFHFWFITVTRRSLSLATAAASLAFLALQTASLCLTTTPPEALAAGLRVWLAPLSLLGFPVKEAALTLLLSLRFMALVFDEARNLALGLAARGVPWSRLPPGGSTSLLLRLVGRLFSNLFQRSSAIAVAMRARGFRGPATHIVYVPGGPPLSWIGNVLALLALPLTLYGARILQ